MISKIFKGFFSTAATKPHVWVNKHTKVICQGMTGNQVTSSKYEGHFPN